MNNKIYGLIGLARRAGKINFGTESSLELVKNRKAKLVIVAEDAAERTKKNFKIECENSNIPFRIFGTIDELSNAVGQDNKAVYAIKDENFAKELLKKIDGGEIIG